MWVPKVIVTSGTLSYLCSTLKYAYPWPLIVSVRDHFASFMSTCANTLDRSRYFESETFLIRCHYCDIWYVHVDVLDVNVPASGLFSFTDSTHVFYSLDSFIDSVHTFVHTYPYTMRASPCLLSKEHSSCFWVCCAGPWCNDVMSIFGLSRDVAPVNGNLVEGSSPHRDSACVWVYL